MSGIAKVVEYFGYVAQWRVEGLNWADIARNLGVNEIEVMGATVKHSAEYLIELKAANERGLEEMKGRFYRRAQDLANAPAAEMQYRTKVLDTMQRYLMALLVHQQKMEINARMTGGKGAPRGRKVAPTVEQLQTEIQELEKERARMDKEMEEMQRR